MQLSTQVNKTMSSREIAELTGKQHKDVLENIRKVLEEAEINSAEFSAQYKDSTGRTLPCFNLPKRECDLVIAGYSVKYRLAIIDRWQELESKEQKQLSPMEMVIISAQAVLRIEQRQSEQDARMTALEAKTSAVIDQHGFYSILAFSNIKKLKVDSKLAARIGRLAAKESKSMGYMIGTVPDARYGRVNTYHEDVLSLAFDEVLEVA